MAPSKAQQVFIGALLCGVLVVIFFIFQPFLVTLILAASFAVMAYPLHQKVLKLTRNRRRLASLLTTVLLIVLVIVPIAFFGAEIYKEARHVYETLISGAGKAGLLHVVEKVTAHLQSVLPGSVAFSFNPDDYVQDGLNWLLQNVGSFFADAAKTAISFFVFLIAFYYLLKDGSRMKDAIIALSPLKKDQNEIILTKLELAVASVLKGNLEIAIIQGALTTVGFMVFGVPNAFLWGSVAAIAALIPGIGTAIVLTPAIIYLFYGGQDIAAIGLALWGMTAVGLIDNFLGPILVGRGAQIHPLLVFLSVLGGFAYFGPFGFLLGPLAVNFLLALLDIYSALMAAPNKRMCFLKFKSDR
ncbi:MAG: hypothetical protein FD164_974 [Nitrospirae bacterium]|nr:MAG: hypothetical protein FD164_974 [Nitrospirota bacterium]